MHIGCDKLPKRVDSIWDKKSWYTANVRQFIDWIWEEEKKSNKFHTHTFIAAMGNLENILRLCVALRSAQPQISCTQSFGNHSVGACSFSLFILYIHYVCASCDVVLMLLLLLRLKLTRLHVGCDFYICLIIRFSIYECCFSSHHIFL